MTVVTNNQKAVYPVVSASLRQHSYPWRCTCPESHSHAHWGQDTRMVWITVPPEIVLNTIGRGEVREQDIHILVLDCQPSQPDFFINFCKELVPQSGQILFRGKLSIGAQNINSRIIDALLALRIDTNLSLVRTSNHQAVDFPSLP